MLLIKQERKLLDDFFLKKSFCSCNNFEINPNILIKLSENLSKFKNFGICLDWAHVNVYGNTNEEWIEMLHPYVKHIHINDNDKKGDLHLPLGTGKIDWEQFFAYYKKYFQNCSVLVEITNPNGQKQSLDYIREKFGCI